MTVRQKSNFVSRRSRGTTLVEVLVVIVVLLVGILAVVQIFPRGFQVLSVARKNAQASQLARDEAERLKSRADGLPEQILGDAPVNQLGLPAGWTINSAGAALDASNNAQGDWLQRVAANHRRTIVGESHRISSPRLVAATQYGSLLMPTFGPIDPSGPFTVTTSDLERNFSLPADLEQISGRLFRTGFTYSDAEYFVASPNTNAISVFVPTGAATDYRISFAALIQSGGNVVRRNFRGVSIAVPAQTPDVQTGQLPFYRIDLSADIVAPTLAGGEVFLSANVDSIRVARALNAVSTFSANPYEYIAHNSLLGSIIVNPLLSAKSIPTSEGRRPANIVFSYRTADWRMLRSDFRLSSLDQGQFRLPIAPIKIGGESGPDGRALGFMNGLDDPNTDGQTSGGTFFTIVDLETGGIVMEHAPSQKGQILVRANKSLGLLIFEDADPGSEGIQVRIRFSDGTNRTLDLEGRSMRAVFMARDEWAVQVYKPASQYFSTPVLPVAADFYVGGSETALGGASTRIYFPAEDDGEKVTIAEIHYIDGGGNRQTISGRDFRIRNDAGNAFPRPYVDIRDVDPSATSFAYDAAPPVRGVKGGSISVRTLWNPDRFILGPDPVTNAQNAERFARGYRRTSVQTYVERGEAVD